MRLRSRLCACSAALALTVPATALPALAETGSPETPAAESTPSTPSEPESAASESEATSPDEAKSGTESTEDPATEDPEDLDPSDGGGTGPTDDEESILLDDLVGTSQAHAESYLAALDLDIDVNIEPRSSEKFAAGVILDTTPSAEAPLLPGSTVTLVVSSGPSEQSATMPKVVGETEARATTLIEETGVDVDLTVDTEASAEVEEGLVIRCDPKPEAELTDGTEVTLVVSSGPETVEVPDVVGDPETDATAELEEQGLQVNREEQYSGDVDEGHVISTDPASGTYTVVGSEVTLVVSLGADPATEEPIDPESPGGSEESSDGGGEDSSDGGEAGLTGPDGPATPSPSPEPSEPGTSGGGEQDPAPVEPSPESPPTVQSSAPEPQQIPEASAPEDPTDPPVEEPAEAETLPVADVEEPEEHGSEEPESPAEESPTEEPTTPAPGPLTPSAGGTGSGESGPVDQFLNAMSDESGGFGRLRPVLIAVIGLGFLTAAGFIGATLRGRQSGGPKSSSI